MTTSCLREIRNCLQVSSDPIYPWIFYPLNLLLVRNHQAEIIIEKRLDQGRLSQCDQCEVRQRSCDQGRRKNDTFVPGPRCRLLI